MLAMSTAKLHNPARIAGRINEGSNVEDQLFNVWFADKYKGFVWAQDVTQAGEKARSRFGTTDVEVKIHPAETAPVPKALGL